MQTMAGTLMPEEQARILQQQRPLIDALRANGGGAMAFNPNGQSFSGGGSGNGMSQFVGNALGGATQGVLKQMGSGFVNGVRNISTANQYGTDPFSQQTNMLQAQDAAFL